jgi:hypothetical protein
MDENQKNKYPGYNIEQQMVQLDIVRAICNDPSFVLQSKLDVVTQFIAAEKDILGKTKGLLRSRALDSAKSLLRSLQSPASIPPIDFFLPAALDVDEAPVRVSAPTTTPTL